MSKPIVLSGCQPSGELTIGNYLGAIKQWTNMQDDHECYYMLVDQHAITVRPNPEDLRKATLDGLALYLACGVDPEKSTIFIQSQVPEHAQLSWVLNCYAQMGELNRMTQFKDKAGKNAERASVGLYTYPVLQAADILAFKGTHVPVGEDQKQHLELSRDIAAKFNHDFGAPNFFPLPEPLIKGPGAKVMSLRDGTKKMSKSDPSDASRINLTDTADQISKKIRKAKTDTGGVPATAEEMEGRPDIANLIGIYSALTDRTEADIMNEHGGSQFGPFKAALAEVAVESLRPVTELMNRYLAAPDEIDAILNKAGDDAAAIADPIVADVRKIIGFRGA